MDGSISPMAGQFPVRLSPPEVSLRASPDALAAAARRARAKDGSRRLLHPAQAFGPPTAESR